MATPGPLQGAATDPELVGGPLHADLAGQLEGDRGERRIGDQPPRAGRAAPASEAFGRGEAAVDAGYVVGRGSLQGEVETGVTHRAAGAHTLGRLSLGRRVGVGVVVEPVGVQVAAGRLLVPVEGVGAHRSRSRSRWASRRAGSGEAWRGSGRTGGRA
jgi:hypothetical protein